MKYVHLGDSNVLVSEFCLGTMMFGGKTGPDESVRIVRRAVEAGVNFVDTADVYNEGRSEEIVGRALQGIRDQVVVASKVAMKVGQGVNDAGVSRYHIVRGAEASLRRLGTDRIDLYYIHWPLTAMNLEEMVRALEDLIRQGKVLYPAFSNFPAWLFTRTMWLQDVSGYAPMVAGQYPYNLIERGLEVEVLPAALALGVGIVTYRPLGAGALTGKYLQGVPTTSRGVEDERQERWTERYRDGITRLTEMARDRGLSAADGAIAWARSHPAVTAPIVGVSTMEQLETNLKGFEWEMTPAEREELAAAFHSAVWEEEGGTFPAWRRSFDIITRC